MQDVVHKLLAPFAGGVALTAAGQVEVPRPIVLEGPAMDALVRGAVFGPAETKDVARWLLWEIGQVVGVRPASIHDLYVARGQGAVQGFTVPAINIRCLTYDTARALFRAAKRIEAAAFLLEIARSEIAYTEQRPAEYVAVLQGAALREGYRGPLFVQGDHCQINAKKYAADAAGEVGGLQALIREEIAAGFYNIDIDTSTLVDLAQPTLDTQQRTNYERAGELAAFVRSLEPAGVTVSVGGEIGEVGGKNSDVHELRAYMDGFVRTLAQLAPGKAGLSKISVQTGTSHGGVVLPDGSIADVTIDFETLRVLSVEARQRYGMAGAVQHGASTLPETAFGKFPEIETAEIHLATAFQSLLFDHPALPAAFRTKLYDWLRENAAGERKPGQTDEQFFYTARKKAIGPFKREWWDLPIEVRAALGLSLEKQFAFLLDSLCVAGTAALVARYVQPPENRRAEPPAATAAAPDDAEAGE
jgi:fructose-bisphosphate aldolase, class II